jgi:predicted DNA-binding helix-hairpin-helix protein
MVDLQQKIGLLGGAAQYDICRGCGTHSSRVRDDLGRWIYPAVHPDGKRVNLLKVLQTNMCENDCYYCAHRSSGNVRRSAFTPDELAATFCRLVSARRAEGLFLSSGICGSVDRSMERMLATVEILRRRYAFRGYIHLKILPGAQDACVEAAVKMADRVSVNLEAPNARRLQRISHSKQLSKQILGPLTLAHRLRRELRREPRCEPRREPRRDVRRPRLSITTQFVVGASDESDRELLSTTSGLYKGLQLARVYYSAFRPIEGTPLEGHPSTPAWREHRLYQADFLLRDYGFAYEELVFDADGRLPRKADPKLTWAQQHNEFFPLELNTASETDLLRVPGIGPKSARTILTRRRQGRLCDLHHAVLGAGNARRAAPFVLLDGKRPDYQLPLWEQGSLRP